MELNFVNLTPHAIVLNDGTVFPPSGTVARVSASFVNMNSKLNLFLQSFGEVENLPERETNTRFIVSAMVLAALKGSRPDVYAPATGHPDCVRDERKQIVSVPGFVF